MSYVTWNLKYEKFDASLSSNYVAPVTVVDFGNIKLSSSLGDGRDSFSFDVLNYEGVYNEKFLPNDRITISRVVNSMSVSTDDVLMVGVVTDAPVTESYNKSSIKVTGYNYSETIMSALVFLDARQLTVPEAIKQALTSVRASNDNFHVSWSSSNKNVKSNNDPFPIVGETFYYKSMNDVLEKLSGSSKTDDGNYYWYINRDNELVWLKRTSAVNEYFDSTTDTYTSLKIKKDLKDVINYVIVKGGIDTDGRPIQRPVADYSSISKNGFKFYIMIDDSSTAQSATDADKKKASSDFGVEVVSMKDDITWASGFNPTWDLSTTYITYKSYVDAFRAYIKDVVLLPLGTDFIKTRSNGKLKVDIQRRPSDGAWSLGSVISCNIAQLSPVAKLMRVQELNYSTSADGYTLVEDIGTA